MNVITKDEFHVNLDEFKINISEGAIFIHPTDTIYGIGCDATIEKAVKEIRRIKERHDTPFSVIAPSKSWIHKNCEIHPKAKDWIDKLPGPYTLILKMKNKKCVAKSVAPNLDTLGVRIPDHWISETVSRLGKPVVTTSANKHGEEFMTSLDNIHPHIENNMSFILYENEKHGRPSMIIDLTNDEPVVVRR